MNENIIVNIDATTVTKAPNGKKTRTRYSSQNGLIVRFIRIAFGSGKYFVLLIYLEFYTLYTTFLHRYDGKCVVFVRDVFAYVRHLFEHFEHQPR